MIRFSSGQRNQRRLTTMHMHMKRVSGVASLTTRSMNYTCMNYNKPMY
ncbi:hypothetical protein LINPERHAP2_LOCUS29194 [Linum perenne]